MKETINHICQLIRDTFHIKSQPIPITVESKTKDNKATTKNFIVFLIMWCALILVIPNVSSFLDLSSYLSSNPIIIVENFSTDLSLLTDKMGLSNLSIIELNSPSAKVIWTHNEKILHDNQNLTLNDTFILDPIIHSFSQEGFCYDKGKTIVYCPLNNKYLIIISSDKELAQSEVLFIYLSIRNMFYEK